MALIRCFSCGKASLTGYRRCQFCGEVLRFNIWTRKLRRNEAYGFLFVFTGILLLMSLKSVGILALVLGLALASLTLFRHRVKTQNHATMKAFDQETDFFVLNERFMGILSFFLTFIFFDPTLYSQRKIFAVSVFQADSEIYSRLAQRKNFETARVSNEKMSFLQAPRFCKGFPL